MGYIPAKKKGRLPNAKPKNCTFEAARAKATNSQLQKSVSHRPTKNLTLRTRQGGPYRCAAFPSALLATDGFWKRG